MYGHHPDYGYGNYGHPPPFAGPESSNSHYGMPPSQGTNSQNNMMMRSQATEPQPIGNTVSPLEFRIHDMNRRLYIFSSTGVSENDQQQWWDAFSHEFFDDDCKLWFVIGSEPVAFASRERYIINRQFIPKFFRSIFDSGMRELQYVLRGPSRECTLANGSQAYENENVLQITRYDQSSQFEVNTEGKLYVEFAPFDEVMNYRIKAWTLELKRSNEFVYNQNTADYRVEAQNPEQENKPRMGFFKSTFNLMTMLKILDPMQSIMSSAKSAPAITPREVMKRTLFQHHQVRQQNMRQQQLNQQMMIPAPEPEKPKPARKRQRKPAANPRGSKKATAAAAAAAAAATNGVPPTVPTASPANNQQFPPNPMTSQFQQMSYPDVMVVGEPSMMGSEFGENDERTISRVENSQYDPNAMQMQSLGQGPNSSMNINGRNMMNQHHPGMQPPPGQQHMPPHSMGSQMPTSMHNPMHMPPGSMQGHGGMPPMPSTMANQMPPPNLPPHTMSNQMPNSRMPPMQGQMPPSGMPGQMSNPNMMGSGMPPMSMSSQMPGSMSNPMPNQMPGGMQMNQMPPPNYSQYTGGPPPQWPPPNSAMITG
ncbi:LIM domain-binding protein 1 [Caenorhabditis elegans]|uniref:LIM domain-binding protein 1 n=1 Tax=Caenorhabditis elegans TaxID=6239 RepID=LIDB1_CAEEL|nr:LIM domain-binding protein 1 [Caenorhabditis elegans]G5EEL0.1 RecName: Full=LIM domain-binding protein 1 [Caenorhabditis elegans]AAB38366.1 F58A3.1a [Caenorhabditis elegans]CAB02669.1 LIM domain-binding protein 1 [Caenorhabditis elegans]|eukprot:NP_509846.1 LIM Domain Binding protein [Caenorhabditis elegans]